MDICRANLCDVAIYTEYKTEKNFEIRQFVISNAPFFDQTAEFVFKK